MRPGDGGRDLETRAERRTELPPPVSAEGREARAKIGNWTTPEHLEEMKTAGWVEKERTERPEEGRILIRLFHPDKKAETHRSLPLDG